jgi:hypothetical protein
MITNSHALTSTDSLFNLDSDIIPNIHIMKKLLFISLLLLSFSAGAQYRALTIRNTGGVTVSGSYLNTTSVGLDYQLNERFMLESWSGINYNWAYENGWFSTQNAMNVILKKGWLVGGGFQINGGMAPGGVVRNDFSKNSALIFIVQKKYMLK